MRYLLSTIYMRLQLRRLHYVTQYCSAQDLRFANFSLIHMAAGHRKGMPSLVIRFPSLALKLPWHAWLSHRCLNQLNVKAEDGLCIQIGPLSHRAYV